MRKEVTRDMKPLEVATVYVRKGWAPTPVLYQDKKATLKGWTDTRFQENDLPKHFNGKAQNIGIVLGDLSNGLVDVDLDCPEAVVAANLLLPKTCTFGRAGNPGSHRLFVVPGIKSYMFKDINGEMLVEIRSTGGQTVFPPSVHKSGDLIEFENDLDPVSQTPEKLLRRVQVLASAALLARHWPKEGSRNHAAMALSGGLLRARMTTEQVKLFVRAVAAAAGDDDLENRVGTVESTATALRQGKEATGWPNLARMVGDDVVNQVLVWLDIMDAKDAAFPEDSEKAATSPPVQSQTQAQVLVELASETTLFHTPEGEAYAVIPVKGHRETWPLDSKIFKQWLSKTYWEKEKKPAGTQALQEALALLGGLAAFEGDEIPVHLRIAGHGDAIFLDLGNENWEVVEITPSGWRIINDPPVRFRRSAGLQALPRPLHGGSVEDLRLFINAPDEDTWVMIVAWLVGALRPNGPYPILLIQGEQGSAKSTTSRVTRSLVDPAEAPLCTLQGNERDLMISANANWVLAYDNLSGLKAATSDALCRLSTGGGFTTRSLYSNRDEEIFKAMRPMILNGIDDIAQRDDLAQRSLVLNLPPIDETNRKPERELRAAFETAYPQILGALLDAVSTGLRNLPHVKLDSYPRMADFAEWVIACEPALPWEQGTFMTVYSANRKQAVMAGLESDLVASTLLSFMDGRPEWTGTATELHRLLEQKVTNPQLLRTKSWPKNARWLSDSLKRAAPKLRNSVGLDVRSRRANDETRTRLLHISWIK